MSRIIKIFIFAVSICISGNLWATDKRTDSGIEDRKKIVLEIKKRMNLFCMTKEGRDLGLSKGEHPTDKDFDHFVTKGFFEKDYEFYEISVCDLAIMKLLTDIFEGYTKLDKVKKEEAVKKIKLYEETEGEQQKDKILRELISYDDVKTLSKEIEKSKKSFWFKDKDEQDKLLNFLNQREGTYVKIDADLIQMGDYGLLKDGKILGVYYEPIGLLSRTVTDSTTLYLFSCITTMYNKREITKINEWLYFPLKKQKVFKDYNCSGSITLLHGWCEDRVESYWCGIDTQDKKEVVLIKNECMEYERKPKIFFIQDSGR